MEPRPKIPISISPFHKKLEWLSLVILLLIWAVVVYSFVTLPAIIPIHFNAAGNPDGYGDKLSLFMLPIIATIIFAAITKLNKYPHIFNYAVNITAANAEKQYTVATNMLRFVKLGVLLLFLVIVVSTYLTTVKLANGLGRWFLPIVIIGSMALTIGAFKSSFSNKNK